MPKTKTTHTSEAYEGPMPEGVDLNIGQPDGVTVDQEIHRIDEQGGRTLLVPAGVQVNPAYLDAIGAKYKPFKGNTAGEEAEQMKAQAKRANPATENKSETAKKQ
jgi:hypothetical protein